MTPPPPFLPPFPKEREEQKTGPRLTRTRPGDPKEREELQAEQQKLHDTLRKIDADKRTLSMPLNRRRWWQLSWRCRRCDRRLAKSDGPSRNDPKGDCPGCGLTQNFV